MGKKKETKKITNLIIVDASSSMSNKAQEIKDGLNDLMEDIREDMKNDKLSITNIICQFSSRGRFTVLLNSNKKKDLNENISESYIPRGMTALYDAIGQGFELIPENQDGVFVNIMTDGEENSSCEYTQKNITELIKEGKDNKWAITFMGTTEDAINNAKNMGIGNTYKFQNSTSGVKMSNKSRVSAKFKYLSSVVSSTNKEDIVTLNLFDDKGDKNNNE